MGTTFSDGCSIFIPVRLITLSIKHIFLSCIDLHDIGVVAAFELNRFLELALLLKNIRSFGDETTFCFKHLYSCGFEFLFIKNDLGRLDVAV